MGLSASPEFFSRVLHKILEGLDSVLIYINDVLVCTDSVKRHHEVLRSVLHCLQKAGLKLNAEKCSFFQKEIEFVGHIWSEVGLRSSPSKLEAIRNMSPPADKQSLHSFLGLVAYIGQRFIAHYSSAVKPLWDMLKDGNFKWTACKLQTFTQIQNMLCQATTLAFLTLPNQQ